MTLVPKPSKKNRVATLSFCLNLSIRMASRAVVRAQTSMQPCSNVRFRVLLCEKGHGRERQQGPEAAGAGIYTEGLKGL